MLSLLQSRADIFHELRGSEKGGKEVGKQEKVQLDKKRRKLGKRKEDKTVSSNIHFKIKRNARHNRFQVRPFSTTSHVHLFTFKQFGYHAYVNGQVS